MILLKLKFLTVYVLKGMAMKDEERALLKNITCENHLGKQKELVERTACKL